MTMHRPMIRGSKLEPSACLSSELTHDSSLWADSFRLPSLRETTASRAAIAELSDGELLAQLATLVKQEQELTSAVLLHLAEVERRGLHLAKGCSSLFGYCVERLGFSEDIAYKRVGGARYCRRFPLALELLTQGSLHLSALMLIGPHLTDTNHRDWLMAAAGKSKREVEKLVATRCPKPDVASSVRKLPQRRPASNATAVLAAREQAQEGSVSAAIALSTHCDRSSHCDRASTHCSDHATPKSHHVSNHDYGGANGWIVVEELM